MCLFREILVLKGLRESPDRKGLKGPGEREARKDLKDLKENKGVLAQLVLVGWPVFKDLKDLKEFEVIWVPKETKVLWVLRGSRGILDLWARKVIPVLWARKVIPVQQVQLDLRVTRGKKAIVDRRVNRDHRENKDRKV